jgi:UDP:flavonoid glycosyltransferase YjiC (YdhE family)
VSLLFYIFCVKAEALGRRIREVLAAPAMAVKAEEVAAAMKRENGVAEAVAIIMARFAGHNEKAAAAWRGPA